MYILSQIFDLVEKNFIISQMIDTFKHKMSELIFKITNDISKFRYINMIFETQRLMNEIAKTFILNLINQIDLSFKNSKKRKTKYHINKSNVKRTIITIFGETTFNRTLYVDKETGEYYFYIDDALQIDSYYQYDPVVRAILVDNATITSPNKTSKYSSLYVFNLMEYYSSNIANISRQTIYRFKRETNIRNIEYKTIDNDKTLYVMADEKWIHKQDKDNPNRKKWIMVKCFVTFTHIKSHGNRNKLINKHNFMTTSDTPWQDFVNEIENIYDFSKLENINLLSDAGGWILSGKDELKLYSNNKITVNTCEFHVKQKISRSTTDKELRKEIADIIYENEDKKAFIKKMDELINSKSTQARKDKVTEYKNYILNHWKGIINMKYSMCKSSMESHIQHNVASSFSEVPKAYSDSHIETYLKLQEAVLNEINIFNYYLQTYNSSENFTYNSKKEVNLSLFENSTSNIPIKCSNDTTSIAINSIAYF